LITFVIKIRDISVILYTHTIRKLALKGLNQTRFRRCSLNMAAGCRNM